MLNWLDQSFRDVRFAARSLVKNPGFTPWPSCRSRIGIMATTAIYSVLHAVVLDPFPYKDVDQLMSVRVSNAAQRGCRTGYSVDQFLEIAERNTIFDGRDRLDDQRRAVDRRRRSAAAARQSRHLQHVRRDGRAAADRPDADRGRRPAGRAAGRRARLSVLAAAVRRRPERARPPAAAERHQPHGHRRDAEALHVARRRRLPADRRSSGARRSRACAACTCSGG